MFGESLGNYYESKIFNAQDSTDEELCFTCNYKSECRMQCETIQEIINPTLAMYIKNREK